MSQKIFENDLAMIRKCKVILTLKKPAYVGVCILELTEALMDKLHYNYIKNEYGSKSRLLFIDTDSSMYEIYVWCIKEFFGLKPNNEYENVLFTCLRHTVNRIQSKNYRIRACEINKISLSCFDDKIYILNNGYDGLVLCYQS